MAGPAFLPIFPGLPVLRKSSFASAACGRRISVAPSPVSPRPARVSCCERPAWSVNVEGDRDVRLYELETELYDAVLQEDYTVARETRDQITRLQSAAFVDVLQSYMGFYRAFDTRSITDMARIWAQDPSASVKHPVGPLIVGYLEVLNEFGNLFALQMPSISPENARISMRGTIAYVTNEEVVVPRKEPGTLRTNFKEMNQNFGDGPAEIRMIAVNIFKRVNGTYLLTHHSSSPQNPTNIL